LERHGFEVTYITPNPNGLIDLAALEAAMRPDTVLVSIMQVNNEIGVIQDIEAIGRLARTKGVLFHVDAAQSAGKLPIDLSRLEVDLMSFSAHKVYGPKGMGALYVRRKPRVRLEAQMYGGGHERGMRSGTLNVSGIVGLARAAELAKAEMADEHRRVFALRERLNAKITGELDEVYLNGHPTDRLAGNLNLSFAYIEGESMLMGLNGSADPDLPAIAVSSGSACTSATLEPSYVLKALGVGDELAHTSIRFGLGRFNTEEEVDYVAERVISEVKRLRELSPLYEMAKEGIDLKDYFAGAQH
jgi:cysteine desulfurase